MVANRRSLILAAVVSASLAATGLASVASADQPDRTTYSPASKQPQSIARGLVIKTTTSTPSAALLKAADAAVGSNVSVGKSHRLSGKISTVDFDKTIPAAAAEGAAANLRKRSDVLWVVPNTLMQANAVSPVPDNDPLFPFQRNLWDTTITSPAGGYSIKAPSFWQKTKGSSDVVVAVVDTGIVAHPQIDPATLVPGYDMIGPDHTGTLPLTYDLAGDGDGRDTDTSDPGDWITAGECSNGSTAQPSSWHGTFVAGEIAALTDDALSIAGAAPGVKIQPVRVLGHCGGWVSDIIAGISWASGGHIEGVPDNLTPAKVVNVSVGYNVAASAAKDACLAYGDVASQGRARGSVFVASAGNDFGNANLELPASCPGFISVGATSFKGFKSVYSNVGNTVDLSAPGGDKKVEGSNDSILSLVNSGTQGPVDGGKIYSRYEGTSTAAPEVSAGAALLYSILPSPANDLATWQTIQNALLASVSPFRAYSSTYAKKAVTYSGSTYLFNLNCAGITRCGKGTLDLSKVQAPLTDPTLSAPVVGEPLTVNVGTWIKTPTAFTYAWFKDGTLMPDQTGSTYEVLPSDVGSVFHVRIASTNSAFSAFTSTSADTPAVVAGANVALTIASTATYGVDGTASVTVTSNPVGDPVVGPVELRRGTTVLATGTTSAVDGTATFTIPGLKWIAGTNNIRAAFLGNGADLPMSTPTQAVEVAKATSATTHSLSDSTIATTTSPKSKVTITVTGVPKPTGLVRVYDGTKYLKTYTMFASYSGVHVFTLPKLKAGKHSIIWKYAGNSNIVGSNSPARTLTVS